MSFVQRVLSLVVACFGVLFVVLFPVARASAANTCSITLNNASHGLCWLDLTGYSGAVGTAVPMSFAMPDGSTLNMTLTNTGSTAIATSVTPTYGGAALGNTSYTGISGKPAFYGTGTQTLQLSNITLTDSQGKTIPSIAFAVADAETLDTGDGTNAWMTYTTTGTAWTQLQVMNSVSGGGPTPICTLTGLGSKSAKCTASASGNNAAYILSTNIASGKSITTSFTSTALQGFAFAIQLSDVVVTKAISTRVNLSDQFTVAATRVSDVVSSVTTTGSGTSFGTNVEVTPSGETFTFTDVAASGNLSNYVSTYQCSNGTTQNTQTLPSGTGTSFSYTTFLDDQITCSFSNYGLVLSDTAATATKSVYASQSLTDVFTLTNGSSLSGLFKIGTPIVDAGGSAITPSGYTFNGTTYASVSSLQSAITTAGATAAGGSISIGIVYTSPASVGASIALSFPATITSGTSTSLVATGTETDTTTSQVSIVKSATSQASPNGLIRYTLVVQNNGTTNANGTSVYDQLPSGLTIVGKPTCTVESGTATCGSSVVSNGDTDVTWSLSSFGANASLLFVFDATATAVGSYANVGYAVMPGPISIPSNSVTTVVAAANGLVKTVRNVTQGQTTGISADTANPGDVLEYGLSFTNTTTTTLSGLMFNDTMPTNTTFLSDAFGTLPAGITSCTVTAPDPGSTGSVRWTFAGSLAGGGTLTATFRVTVK